MSSLISELQKNTEGYDIDIISESEYHELDEGAKRAFRRVGTTITQYYRCTSGKKKGKLSASPQSCGQRADPAKVRHGRVVARTKGAIRVRKTGVKKKTQISKRVTKLNTNLSKSTTPSTTIKPMVTSGMTFVKYLNDITLNEQE